jgi:hypothetical protein
MKRRRIAGAIFLLCLVAYLLNGRTTVINENGDSVPARLIPFSLLRFGRVTMDPFRADLAAVGGPRYYALEIDGKLVSYYPIAAALAPLPFYLPYYAWLALTGRTDHASLFAASGRAEKGAASVIASLAAALLFLLLEKRTALRWAIACSLAFGLCTSMWAVASQQLWQHGSCALCLVIGLAYLADWRRGRHLAAAGLWLGMASAIRPPAVVYFAAGALWAMLSSERAGERRRRALAWYGLGLVPLVLTAGYNLELFGQLLGGYRFNVGIFPRGNMVLGALGLLMSPNRGILVFSPVVLPGLAGIVRAILRPMEDLFAAVFSAAAVIYFLIHAATSTWGGGWSFGGRYLIEILPVVALAACPSLPGLGRWRRRALLALAAWSLIVQLDGAFCYPASGWDSRMSDAKGDIEAHAWDLQHWMLWEDFQAWTRGRS